MADEIGKPISQGRAEISKCILLCNYYYKNAEKFLKNKEIQSEFSRSYISYLPIGIVLGIMP